MPPEEADRIDKPESALGGPPGVSGKPPAEQPRIFTGRERRAAIAAAVAASICLAAAGWYYVKFARRIDRQLRMGPFSDSVDIYAAPQTVAVGDRTTPAAIVAHLRQSGYGTSRSNPMGWYTVRPHQVEIFPGRRSYFDQEPAVIEFEGGKIVRIVSLQDNTERPEYRLEPQLITNLSDEKREKRRLVAFGEIPPVLVRAVLAVEDKHFFRHAGIDMLRIFKAAYVDLRTGRKQQGASTLSMQLARLLWLHPDKSFRRKMMEVLIALHLEARLSKEQIFEYYANEVYLGRRGTFNINGFGEGARVYFGKEIGKLTLPEAATLAGMVQRPSYFNPFRHPDRVRERRNVVLALMRQNGYLTGAQYRQAAAAPLGLAPGDALFEDIEAQYFVDLVNDELQQNLGDAEDLARSLNSEFGLSLERLDFSRTRTVNELAVHVAQLLGVMPLRPAELALGVCSALAGLLAAWTSSALRVWGRRPPLSTRPRCLTLPLWSSRACSLSSR